MDTRILHAKNQLPIPKTVTCREDTDTHKHRQKDRDNENRRTYRKFFCLFFLISFLTSGQNNDRFPFKTGLISTP